MRREDFVDKTLGERRVGLSDLVTQAQLAHINRIDGCVGDDADLLRRETGDQQHGKPDILLGEFRAVFPQELSLIHI